MNRLASKFIKRRPLSQTKIEQNLRTSIEQLSMHLGRGLRAVPHIMIEIFVDYDHISLIFQCLRKVFYRNIPHEILYKTLIKHIAVGFEEKN